MSLRPLLRACTLALLALFVLVPTAQASSMQVSIEVPGILTIVDTDGGPHDLTVDNSSVNEWTISDAEPGSTLLVAPTAMFDCGMVGSDVVCTSASITSLNVNGADGAVDIIDVRSAQLPAQVFGRGGNDDIIGTDVDDILDGGAGSDQLDGRLGNDMIAGGNGVDQLYGGGGDDSMQAVDGEIDTAVSCDGSMSLGGTPGPTANGDNAHIDLDLSETAAPAPDCDTVERHADSGGGTPPSNTVLPAAPAGTVAVGSTLSSNHGTWTGDEPMTFTQQWQRCDASGCYFIPGATSLSYVLTEGDINYQLRLKVFANNAAGSGVPAASPMSAKLNPVAPFVYVAPSAPSGTVKIGSKLTSSYGQWGGTAPVTTTGQWQRCNSSGCTNISGATSTTYTIPPTADIGFQLRFRVVASNAAGSAESFSSKTIAVPKPVAPAPNDPPKASGSSCFGNEKATKVGSLFICYGSASFVQNNIWNLTGPITINRSFFFADSRLFQIDLNRKLIIAQGPSLKFGLVKPNGDWARVFTATDVNITNPGDVFSIDMWNAKLPDPYTSGGLRHTIIDANGYYADGPSQLKVTGYQSARKFGWTSGVRLLNNALSVTGEVNYDYTGAMTTHFHGCWTGQLPVQASNIVQITNPCVDYDPNIRQWKLSASATILNGQFSAKANAGLVNGGLDNIAVDVNAAGKVPFAFGSYLNSGGINVGGFVTGVPSFGGHVGGGWPYDPATSTAEIVITGDIQFVGGDYSKLTIEGTGRLYAGGQQIADSWANITLALATKRQSASFKARTHMNALGGFIEGDATVQINGGGWFAETKANVGFQPGSDITNLVDYRIREYTRCHWASVKNPFNGVVYTPCPRVDGWSANMNVVVSNKGAGVKGGIGSDPNWRVSATCWWSTNEGWGANVAWSDSKSLDFLKRVQDKYGQEIVADVSSDTFVVAPGTQFIALQLDGSTTGNVVVRNPKGVVVADTAAGTFATDVGFGRDPAGGAAAVLMIPKSSIVPGTWTVVRSGDAPFSKVTPVQAAADVQEAKLTKVATVGGPTTRLTAGSSKLLLTWTGPKDAKVALRATTPDGTTSLAIKSGLASHGSLTWRVPIEWVGPLRIQAVTERGGVGVSTETFPTTFTVIRPLLAAPRLPRLTRLAKGTVAVGWNAIPGAKQYIIEVRIRGVKKPILFGSKKPNVKLNLDARGLVRVRVQGLSSLGVAGNWSKVAVLGQAPRPRPVRRPTRRPVHRH